MRRDGPTRERIIDAALQTLKTAGFAGASARAVAKAGGFNQALIYYYFPSLDELLLAALAQTSAIRMDAYVARLAAVSSIEELVAAARELFDEDVEAGHITVLTELIAAALPSPHVGTRIVELMEPWVRLMQDTIARFTRGSMIETMLPERPAAESIVAFYLGLEMLYHLDRDRSRAASLFSMLSALAPILAPFVNAAPAPDGAAE